MSFKWFAPLIVTTIAAGVGFATVAFATAGIAGSTSTGSQETQSVSEAPARTVQEGTQEAPSTPVEDTAAMPEAKTVDFALERARREVKLLDTMYKTSIVLITEHYVNSSDDLPAGEAFKLLFAKMEDTGWHHVRLIDASGEPINDDNEPTKGFESAAIKQLLAGKSQHEEIIEEDGKRFLRAATAVPVVMEKCVMCHENYKDVPKGQAIGAIGYRVPILENKDLLEK